MARKLKAFERTSASTHNGKRGRRNQTDVEAINDTQFEADRPQVQRPSRLPIVAKNENQKRYMNAMRNFTVTIGTGPAGVGKTYLAASFAAEKLMGKEVRKVIITRPAVESGASMGFLPGSLEEKFEPYMAPFKEVMIERMGKSHYDNEIRNSNIQAAPLNYMRGATFKDAVVILDEAQNCTPAEMKMFLTRIGENCTVIINGDIDQCDLNGPCGLEDAVNKIGYIPAIKVIEFSEDDSVRSPIVKEILRAYRRDNNN